jgi:hypothetical protein
MQTMHILPTKKEDILDVSISYIQKYRFNTKYTYYNENYPSKNRKEGECNCSLYVVNTITIFWSFRLVPRIGQVTKSNKIKKCPKSRETMEIK